MGKNYNLTKRKTNPKSIQLTDRDVAVIKSLYRFDILSTDQLHKLVGGGRDGFRRRLRLLFDAGYITRPPIQNELFRYGDKRPSVHSLGSKGAEYLRIVCGLPVAPTIDWDRKARDRKGLRGQFLVLHSLGANLTEAAGDAELVLWDGREFGHW